MKTEIEKIVLKSEIKLNFRLFCLNKKDVDGYFVQETKVFKTRMKLF